MSRTKTGSNATFTGPQEGLTIIGDHCYGYSGLHNVNDTELALLKFDTGTEYIRAIIQFNGGAAGGGDNYAYRVKLNSQIVQEYVTNNNTDDAPNQKLNLIIPPHTSVECTAQNATDASNNEQIVSISGKVYG